MWRVCWLLALIPALVAQAPALDGTSKAQAREMLAAAKAAIRANYYDTTFHGLDLDSHFKATEASLNAATSLGHAYAIIAQALIDLGDSHTYFLPPQRSASYDYGWQIGIVGDDCYVIAVRPGSDAEAKGVRPGDRVLQVGSFVPTRQELWKVRYLYYMLSPRSSLKVTIQPPGGEPRGLEIAAKVTQEQAVVEISLDSLIESGPGAMADPIVRANRTVLVGDISVSKLSTFAFADGNADRVMRT